MQTADLPFDVAQSFEVRRLYTLVHANCGFHALNLPNRKLFNTTLTELNLKGRIGHTRRDGNRDHVEGEGPEQILFHDPHGLPGQGDCVRRDTHALNLPNRKLFNTTLTELKAMAALASTGLS